ncbi:NrfD/PsrC family molybdoenzyme membrane anchor subunit [Pseudodesulfovibrio sp.]|uniref:NrfD/PsrC family molybdoenzyme membrane anchor subunit n=1 Tax=Pseudodesulfovibrio sp. TaxID=2035812 RepID=UPI00260B6A84|nr:NrfD/PsrC family molybdoenzyme membrane anchor subunit [Pseudodesulfovibrio sp.]MDD3311755.1 polysulfide reductase NrfD [Pseudodesulfovibrio sp.]
MPKVIELVNAPPAVTWGVMEPLALALLTAAAGAVLLAGILSLAGRGADVRRLLLSAGAAATVIGMGALALSLGSPLHLYMFLVSPSFSSWTTLGTFLLPLFLAATCLALYLDATGHARRNAAALALLLALGVLTYTSREVGYLQGRVMWHWKLLPVAFAMAGLAGGAGLAALLGALRRQAVPAGLLALAAVASLFCAGATGLFAPPTGFVPSQPAFWAGLAVVGVVAAALCLAALRLGALAPVAGLASYLAGFAFYAKVIFLGQSIPRNAFTPVDAEAVARLVSVPSVLAVLGSLAFLLALGAVLSGLFTNAVAAQGGHSHG